VPIDWFLIVLFSNGIRTHACNIAELEPVNAGRRSVGYLVKRMSKKSGITHLRYLS